MQNFTFYCFVVFFFFFFQFCWNYFLHILLWVWGRYIDRMPAHGSSNHRLIVPFHRGVVFRLSAADWSNTSLTISIAAGKISATAMVWGFFNLAIWCTVECMECLFLLQAHKSKTLLWCSQVLKSSLKVQNSTGLSIWEGCFVSKCLISLMASWFLVPILRCTKRTQYKKIHIFYQFNVIPEFGYGH